MSLVILTIGIGIRSFVGKETLFIGTILIGSSIAIGNVLLPSLIKYHFMKQIGMMTGLYAVSMNLFGAVGSGISIPISSSLGLGWSGLLDVGGFYLCSLFLFGCHNCNINKSLFRLKKQERK